MTKINVFQNLQDII